MLKRAPLRVRFGCDAIGSGIPSDRGTGVLYGLRRGAANAGLKSGIRLEPLL